MKSTVGDLDLLVACKESDAVMKVFTSQKDIARVLGKGETKSSIEFTDGMRAQLWVHPPERFGDGIAICHRVERSQRCFCVSARWIRACHFRNTR